MLTAIQLLQFRIRGLCVLVLVDNTTAVAYLRNQGGTRSKALSKLSRRILLLAHNLQVTLVPSAHITGQLNVLADLASRVDQVVPSEWALTSEAFSWVSQAVSLGSSGGGHVCKRQQSQARDVHVTVPRRESNRRGRPSLSLAGKDYVRLSSDVHSTSRTQQNAIGNPVQDSPGPVLVAARQLDPDVELASAPFRTSVSSHADVGASTALGSRTPGSASIEPSALVSREDRMRQMGFSDKVISRLDKARASSTCKHYKSQWDLFESWAVKNGLNRLDAGLPLLTQFLEYLFTVRKVGLRTIKNYRSAIAHYWKSSVGYEIPDVDPVLKDLFRGFAREKPIPRETRGRLGRVFSFAVFEVR